MGTVLYRFGGLYEKACWLCWEICEDRPGKKELEKILLLGLTLIFLLSQQFFKHKNYNGVMQIVSALEGAAIHRLSKTFEVRPPPPFAFLFYKTKNPHSFSTESQTGNEEEICTSAWVDVWLFFVQELQGISTGQGSSLHSLCW